jgi:hypothetical protein
MVSGVEYSADVQEDEGCLSLTRVQDVGRIAARDFAKLRFLLHRSTSSSSSRCVYDHLNPQLTWQPHAAELKAQRREVLRPADTSLAAIPEERVDGIDRLASAVGDAALDDRKPSPSSGGNTVAATTTTTTATTGGSYLLSLPQTVMVRILSFFVPASGGGVGSAEALCSCAVAARGLAGVCARVCAAHKCGGVCGGSVPSSCRHHYFY